MDKKINWLEIIIIVPTLLFLISISLYHISYYGYLGLPKESWGRVWSISENGLLLSLCASVLILSYGIIRKFFAVIFCPYFAMKIVYHLTYYFNIKIHDDELWDKIWSYGLVFLFLSGLIYLIILIRRRYVA
jgi:hypothetical protein